MREDYGQSGSSGFYLGFAPDGKQYELTYFQEGGQMRSDGSASARYLFTPDVGFGDIEKAMKGLLKDPKIVKMKKAFGKMAQGQADYYSRRPMKNWPGI